MKYFVLAILIFGCNVANAAVLINEIAWMGTSADNGSSNEWIELSNSGVSNVDLSSWILRIEGKKDIILAGSITANGYYLIERTDDNTLPDVTADLVASFGTGLANTGATLILLNKDGIEMDRVNGNDNWKIQGGETVGNNTTKETAQRTNSGWITGAPTPRAQNIGGTTQAPQLSLPAGTASSQSIPDTQTTKQTTPQIPSGSQITVDVGSVNRMVLRGAPVVFEAHVFGPKKEPVQNARVLWSFGDGATADGLNITHTYSYDGEYILSYEVKYPSFLEGRIHVDVITPELKLNTGGDRVNSFISIENNGSDEIDLSGVRIFADEKSFILPKIILDAKAKVTLPSEQTGLTTPSGTIVTLSFPNGKPVPVETEALPVTPQAPLPEEEKTLSIKKEEIPTKVLSVAEKADTNSSTLSASAVDALISTDDSVAPPSLATTAEENMWPWYIGMAFFAALAILGVRFVRKVDVPALGDGLSLPTADDFEITEEK
ncbi:MAG: lamin tail domain-containing protein [Candidatus Pacebacteria bacterium]|nr:lamin tail domain-containing protein [Candidatus Paceibacterota bacterium]